MLPLDTAAPDFTLPTASGQPFTLSQHRGRPLVLYFYPKDDTRGCTAEACSFRDKYEDFLAFGAEVVGVSVDDEASHQRFAQKHRLPFTLLADVGGRIRKLYDVPRLFGILPMSGRVTYVIDAAGIVRHAFNSNAQPLKHVSETLAYLKRLTAEPGAAPLVSVT